MSEMNKTGGPAFPHTDSLDSVTRPGMTLRDYFAAKAMAACILNAAPCAGFGTSNPRNHENYAKAAYIFADAMLAEREK